MSNKIGKSPDHHEPDMTCPFLAIEALYTVPFIATGIIAEIEKATYGSVTSETEFFLRLSFVGCGTLMLVFAAIHQASSS